MVHEDGSILASVPGQVALTVSLDIQPGDTTASMDRILPNACVYRTTSPHNVAWKPDLY
jgi:hypothetical protein